MNRWILRQLAGALLLATTALPAMAGVVVYEDEENHTKVEIGARVQLLYIRTDAIGEEVTDFLNFRRLRPYVAGTVTENWWGKFQADFGKSEDADEVAVKDAYMQYRGWNFGKLTIGNAKAGFSREYMTSSKEQQTIERTFVGSHNFGTPDRIIGFHLTGFGMQKKLEFQGSLGSAAHDPDLNRIDLDSPANNVSDWNQALVASGRIDYHPFGYLKKVQTNFDREMKMSFGVGGYVYSNDGDRNSYTDADGFCTSTTKCDLKDANGIELSGSYRGSGIGIDVEYQLINAALYDPTVNKGVYRNGETTLDKFAIEGGYLFPGNRWEIAAVYSFMDADYYETKWTRTVVGVNYYWNKSKTKAQINYWKGSNTLGIRGKDTNNILAMMQYVF